jgi:hypothetical protein
MYTDEMPAHLTLGNKQLPIDQYINILLLFFKKLIFLELYWQEILELNGI